MATMKTTMKPMNVVQTVRTVYSVKEVPAHLKKVIEARSVPEPTLKQPTVPANSTPKSPMSHRPEFLEPVSPRASLSPKEMIQEYQRKNVEEFLQWEMNQPSTWLRQIEEFEKQRAKIVKRGKLSAEDAAELDRLDKEIAYCESVLADLEDDSFEDSE